MHPLFFIEGEISLSVCMQGQEAEFGNNYLKEKSGGNSS
jgi:hypothetical protein